MQATHEWLAVTLHQTEMSSHFDKVRLLGSKPPGAVETEFKCAFCWEPNCYPEVVPTKTGKTLDTCYSKVSKASRGDKRTRGPVWAPREGTHSNTRLDGLASS